LVVVSINFPFVFFKHVFITSCWVHPMMSVDSSCAFAFSLGGEGQTSDHLDLYWTLNSELVRTETDDCRYENCDIDCGNRHVHVHWHNLCVYEQVTSPQWHRWSTRTSETFTTVSTPWKHSSSFRTSHVMEGLHNCNVARSSSHRLWRLHQRVVRLSTSPWFILIVCDTFTNDSSVCLHYTSPWFIIMTTCFFFR
jgi:hypothetical protein